MRRRIMAANWKMYKTAQQAALFFERFRPLAENFSKCDIVVFPTTLALTAAVQAVSETAVQIGGQNSHWGREGAFTGEVSAEMLHSSGATWLLVGHSERRQYFHESDADVLKKTQSALKAGLTPIICMGEGFEDHKSGKANEVLVRQFAGGVAGLTEEEFARVAIAYEPIWAIGTGQTATPAIASDAHRLIRSEVERRFGRDASAQVRIIYGGSVKPENAAGLMRESELDGTLVGGASLDAESFWEIVSAA